jgi:uncharacterized protein (DUF1810 family)
MPDEDAFRLERFVTAQAPVYIAALAELQAGRKRDHWSQIALDPRKLAHDFDHRPLERVTAVGSRPA